MTAHKALLACIISTLLSPNIYAADQSQSFPVLVVAGTASTDNGKCFAVLRNFGVVGVGDEIVVREKGASYRLLITAINREAVKYETRVTIREEEKPDQTDQTGREGRGRRDPFRPVGHHQGLVDG